MFYEGVSSCWFMLCFVFPCVSVLVMVLNFSMVAYFGFAVVSVSPFQFLPVVCRVVRGFFMGVLRGFFLGMVLRGRGGGGVLRWVFNFLLIIRFSSSFATIFAPSSVRWMLSFPSSSGVL